MMNPNKPMVSILGIGNTLYSDEGIGVHILPHLEDAFQEDENVLVIDGSTDGIKLLGPVEETDYLIIIDAINSGAAPGTLIRVEGEDIPKYFGIKMSIHQQGFSEVLAAALWRGNFPSHMVLLGMQPASLEFGIGLTSEGEAAIPQLIEQIREQINQWNGEV